MVDQNSASFVSGMIDLEVGWLEWHEIISKKVIRAIQMNLDRQPVLTSSWKWYYELVRLSDGTFSNKLI